MVKKAFTLIELMVVIVVILILMLLTLKLGWSYIANMQVRNDKEDFVSTYYSLVSQSMSSSFYNGKKYTKASINFSDNSGQLGTIYYDWTDKNNISTKKFLRSIFSGVTLNWVKYNSWNLILESYKFWCILDGWTWNQFWSWKVYMDIVGNNWQKYCFNIILNSCKLYEYKCD